MYSFALFFFARPMVCVLSLRALSCAFRCAAPAVSKPIGLNESKIVTDSEHQRLCRFVGMSADGNAKAPELKLLYRGSRDGFAAADFHRLCDGKGPTVAVVQTPQGCVFGGYAAASWNSTNSWVSAPGSFLFTLRNSRNLPPQRVPLKDPEYAMGCYAGLGPIYGGGYDLRVRSQANANSSSSRLGHSYALPEGCTSDLLAGAHYFTVSEVEVFGRRFARTCVSQCWSECSPFSVDCSCCVGGAPVLPFSAKRCIRTFVCVFSLFTLQFSLSHVGLQFGHAFC